MTKAELILSISTSTGVDLIDTRKVVEEFMKQVRHNLSGGENIYLRGFGTFERITRKAKIARNISKGTALPIPAHFLPKFKPCKEFKEQVK